MRLRRDLLGRLPLVAPLDSVSLTHIDIFIAHTATAESLRFVTVVRNRGDIVQDSILVSASVVTHLEAPDGRHISMSTHNMAAVGSPRAYIPTGTYRSPMRRAGKRLRAYVEGVSCKLSSEKARSRSLEGR